MTQEEIDAANEAEKLAQAQDLEDAKAEEQASNAAMAALEGAFVPNGITRHRGVGPIQYETRRGLIKVFPGDLVCRVTGPTNPDDPPEDWILEEDFIICSQVILTALLFTVPPEHFPDVLEYRAARIGEERRKAAAEAPEEPPVALSRKEGESDEDFRKRQAEDRKKRDEIARKKREDAAKKRAEGRGKPTQLPAPKPTPPTFK